MAAENFSPSLALVLRYEGGFVNNPKDPGGATNYGVTQATYDAFRRSRNMPCVSVRYIAKAERNAIYRREYWDRVAGDGLPAGLDFATFDGGVNSGVSRGAKWLQGALGVAKDGKVGMKTLAAANGTLERTKVIRDMCAARLSFLHRLTHWKTFGKGWSARVANVEAEASRMALEAVSLPADKIREHLGTQGAAAKLQAKKESAKSATSAGAATASGITADQTPDASAIAPAGLEHLWPWILGGVCVAALVVAGIYLYRTHVNKTRAAAYGAQLKALFENL
ncbi:glycoside hydrolase family 108 protein [Breoghania sp.]|uniref:glycoside hydrolase family 108 protein n=1 Tax=Breoghania sp. TaxID=2065378 RepID=UPI002AA8E5AE|nr:glycoside hydrolase family 108 protein [Breoghania sp.]